jgi:glycosyltransferase involved in cell wall biosynthesis
MQPSNRHSDRHSPVSLSGCTFIRNGTQLGFPYIESICSILPIVDEFVVVVGRGEDDTLNRIQAIADPKIRVIQSTWNERMGQRGFVYAQQKMISQYLCTGDWVFYLEGDEIVHEGDHAAIVSSLARHHNDPDIEALVFDYLHFYGSPQWIAVSPRWYRRECRIIRNTIRSFAPDGQYWVVMDRNRRGRAPRCALAQARIYHYGHVRRQSFMQAKMDQVSKYWDHEPPKVRYANVDPKSLRPFEGRHPAIIAKWLADCAESHFEPPSARFFDLQPRDRKHRISMMIERLLGVDLSRKHYRLVKTD